MTPRPKVCNHCSSPMITYKQNGRLISECSYCGRKPDSPDLDIEPNDEDEMMDDYE